MMRPGQHNNNNNKRGRGRNRSGGGGGGSRYSGGGGGGSNYNGNPANRVYDSNGPDVKLRGTAQTVAEKYMQLGRDAHSSGDGVMAESYYQHAEHYYRLWLANQPAGQPIQFSRGRGNDDEFEDEANENSGEMSEAEGSVARVAEGEPAAPGETEAVSHDDQQRQPRQPREFNDSDNNREGGQRRERFRSRWPRRGERNEGNRDEVQPQEAGEARDVVRDAPAEAQERAAPRVQRQREEETDANWEAPSFLKRPVPQQRDETEAVVQAAPKRGRPRNPAPSTSDEGSRAPVTGDDEV
jgi:Domain of unknown function (DUF4167)